MVDVQKTLIITTKVEGAAQTKAALEGIASGYDKVADSAKGASNSTDTLDKKALSFAAAYKRQTLQLDEAARAQDQMARASKVATNALNQGIITQQEHAGRLELIRQRYELVGPAATKAATGIDHAANSTKLARHELINLGRQAQDVVVSLQGGQGLGTVLLQQGSQIADVFISSQATVRGMFNQITEGVGKLFTPMRTAVLGTTAFAASAAYAAASWSSGQKDISRALAGIGQASGTTRDQINQIGDASASAFGLSASEAREAATGFAATGKIYADNSLIASRALKDFARAMGVDVAEAQKRMTGALLEPSQGALELNKSLGFLNLTTLNYIRSLEQSGDLQGAQKALLEASAPAAKKMADQVGGLSKAWTATTNATSEFFDLFGKGSAIVAQKLTGIDFGGISDEKNLENARKKLAELQASPFQGSLAQPMIKAAADELARLEEKARRAAEAVGDKRFAQFALAADAATRAIIPQIDQIEKLTAALSVMYKLADRQQAETGTVDPRLKAALQIGEVQKAAAIESEAMEARRAQRVAELVVQYEGVGIQTAQALDRGKDLLAVAEQSTVAGRLQKQEIATTNELLDRGFSVTEATLRATQQRAIAQAEINSQARANLSAMEDQLNVAKAVTGAQRMTEQAIATQNALLRANVDPAVAHATASKQLEISTAQVNANAQATLLIMQQQLGVAQAVGGAAKIAAQGAVTYAQAISQGVDPTIAAAMAATQMAAGYAAVNSQVKETILGLKDQYNIAMAVNQLDKNRAKEIATYNKLVLSGADEALAAQQAGMERLISDHEELRRQAEEAQREHDRQIEESIKKEVEARKAILDLAEKTAEATAQMETAMAKIAADGAAWRRDMQHVVQSEFRFDAAGLFQIPGGGFSQFKPGGYESTNPLYLQQLELERSRFGEGGTSTFGGPPNQQGLTYMTDLLLRSGGSLVDAINKVVNIGPVTQDSSGLLQQLTDLLPDADKQNAIERQLENLRRQPISLAREQLIKQLNDSLEQLKQSTDQLNNTIGLSGLYGSDPRTSHIGYRTDSSPLTYDPFKQPAPGTSTGGGPIPFRPGLAYAGGGIAYGPQLAMFGEGSTPEAYVPVPSGRIPVEMSGGSGPVHIDARVIIQGNADENVVTKVKLTQLQQAQRLASMARAGAR